MAPFMQNTDRLLSGCYWLLTFAGLWWLLSDNSGWFFAMPCILGATLLAMRLQRNFWSVRLRYLPGFIVFFLIEVFAGGWDVARRALHPAMPLKPGWVDYPMHCDDQRLALMMSAMLGLFPGTLSSKLENNTLCIHVLDTNQAWHDSASRLEQQLMRLLSVKPC